MEKKTFKTSLFGYSKTGVCEYIAQINEEFSERLMDVTDENKKDKEELKAKIAGLESELERYRQAFGDIGAALLDAQQHASSLKQQAEEENRRLISENAERAASQTKRIEMYKTAIDDLRRRLSVLADETDEKLQSCYDTATDIASEFEAKEETAL